MTLADFEALKDFILLKNPYFSKGYANAFKENVENIVWSRGISGELIPVAPRDDFGNYFYLRNDEGIIHEQRPGIMQYGAGHTQYLDTIRVNIVGVLKEGDAMLVVDNIINTVAMYESQVRRQDITLRLVTSNWNREQIVISELSGIDANDINAALKRLGRHVVFKVIVLFSKLRTPTSCINDICQPCSIPTD